MRPRPIRTLSPEAATHRSPRSAATALAKRDELSAILAATGSRLWETDQTRLATLQRAAAAKQPTVIDDRAPAKEHETVAPADLRRFAAFLEALPKAPLPCTVDVRLKSATGRRWTRLTVNHRSGSGRKRLYSGIVTDISKCKGLEEEILRISEREQNRIGQDLHDDLCQVLAGLSCLTRVLENRLAPQVPHEVDNLREINRQLVDAMDRTRALTHGLYPAKMRSGDARPALLELAKQVEVRFGVTVKTSFRGQFPAHEAHEILHVYRIAQEALSNAIRHGRATRLDVSLERKKSGMCLCIRDNGTGFPAEQPPRQGIGLQIMQHRADEIGATITVGNSPRRGASVVLHYQPAALL